MGKNGRLGKDYEKIVGNGKETPRQRSGFVKKADSKPNFVSGEKDEACSDPAIPVEFQQLLLNIFKTTFPSILASDMLQPLLQNVKSALYERDFTRAFGKKENLEVYSIRWSPSRALSYLSILIDVQKHLAEIFPLCRTHRSRKDGSCLRDVSGPFKSTMQVVCFGGGAAEIVAFGGFLRYFQSALKDPPDDRLLIEEGSMNLSVPDKSSDIGSVLGTHFAISAFPEVQAMDVPIPEKVSELDLVLIDTAQWQEVVHKLQDSLTTPPPLSKYASASARRSNSPLIAPEDIHTTFLTEDVLAIDQSRMIDLIGKQPMLLTLLFTLNELYTFSVRKTTAFLLNVTVAARPGSLLLVVDSPGSYSETMVGAEAKKYPMQWLLDHTLLEVQKSRGQESSPDWVKVVSEDSRWFRVTKELRYPIPLENMRYQMHLYRRM
jgi:25S rRNA (uracil2843-N3)-methyltransferase